MTINAKPNLMMSPINMESGDPLRVEMSKTPTYRTDIIGNNSNNSMILNKNSGAGLNGQPTSQRMVQIIENSSNGKGTMISDFEK